MFGKLRGADMVEWIVGVVIVLSILATSVYTLLSTVGNKFTEMNDSLLH
jgi:Flp pilus assembly pilin Flp